jgi:hypothetical protein
MSEQPSPEPAAGLGREDRMSALFLNLVLEHSNTAMIFLGQAPHPETGQRAYDLDAAQFFIDQLEMLELKTRGNLDQREEAVLRQSLAAVRLAFVEAVERGPAPAESGKPASQPTPRTPDAPPPAGTPAAAQPQPAPDAGAAPGERKKFVKKY